MDDLGQPKPDQGATLGGKVMRHAPMAAAVLAGSAVSFGVGLLVIRAAKLALIAAVGGAALASIYVVFLRRRMR